ncbi:Ig-like domain repeat protein, partial [Methanobrevibacter sp.]|uniref:Ig-like domain repeat protein n=1 Tax=Methanobrevibacter sp. TaxID=66852 RepID=UPI0038910A8D
VVFYGDDNYDELTVTAEFTVSGVVPEITVDIDDVTYPDKAVAEITVGNNANGTVNITVDGKVFNGTVENGKATVDLTGLSAGAKVADVEFFSTDDYNDNAAASAKFNVNKAGSSIDIDVNATYYVDEGIVISLRPTNSTGAISVTINGEKYNVIDNKVIIPKGLSADSYTIVANLAGDDNYESSYATATFDVIKYGSDISIEVKDVFVVDEEIVIALNTENVTDVSVTINGKPYTVVDNRVVIPNGLANGTYFIVAKFDGDDKYLASEANATFGVNKLAPTDVTAEDLTFVVGHEGILEISGPADRTANLIVSIGDDDYNVELNDGKATLDVSELPVGEYNVDITYLENDKYTKAEFTNAATITVNDKDKADVNVTVDVENKTITVDLPEDATGNVTVIIDGKVYNVTDAAESPVIINISDVEPGNHTIEVIYSGDDNFNPASNVTDVEVPKVDDYEITVDAEVDGNSVDITVSLPEDVTGPVLIDVDGVGYYANVTDGQAKLHLDDLSAGNHDVAVKYPGDDYYAPKGNATSFTVDKSETPISIEVEDGKVIVELPEDATGNVTVTIDGKDQTVPIEDGKAVVDISDLEPGNHTIEVNYPGDDNYKPTSNSTIIDVPKISDYPINITEEDGKLVVNVPEDATGNVTVTIDGKDYTAPIEDGKAVLDISDVEPGKHGVEVTYPGDDKYAPASNSTIIDVPKISDYPFDVVAEDIKAGEKTNITINLPEDVNGPVLVDIDGIGYYANVTDGVAHVELPLDLKPGTYDVVVTFPGNDKYEGKSVSDSFTIDPNETPMDVKVEDGKVIVELPEDATGNVTVTIDGKDYTAPIEDGKAVMDLPSDLEPGNHIIDVNYPGDDKYDPASNSTTVDVPKIDDYPINVTNTDDELVIDVPDDATGDVIVNIDGKEYTVPIKDGKAVLDISDLPAGEHDVKVTYPGNDKYAPKTVNTTVDKKRELVITAPDVVKYYSGPERFYVYFTDKEGNNIDGLTVKITINGVTYERTSKDGQVSLALTLNSGNYTAKVEFAGNSEFEPQTVYANVNILPTIYGNNVFKVFKNGTQYYALFVDGEGNPLPNIDVFFNIHGVFYTRTTNASGWAKLNINLERGEYILTALNPVTGEMRSNNITVISLIVENKDITKYFRNATQYTARIVLPNGSYAGAGEAVTFNINGVFYTRYTDANGYVKLNINLDPGDYFITVKYRDCTEGNNIKVLPTLITSDLVMNYGDGSQFVAQVLDGQGKPYPNQRVSLNVHGILYNRISDSNGMVKININLERGEYLITSECNSEVHANTISVR